MRIFPQSWEKSLMGFHVNPLRTNIFPPKPTLPEKHHLKSFRSCGPGTLASLPAAFPLVGGAMLFSGSVVVGCTWCADCFRTTNLLLFHWEVERKGRAGLEWRSTSAWICLVFSSFSQAPLRDQSYPEHYTVIFLPSATGTGASLRPWLAAHSFSVFFPFPTA